MKTTKYLSKLLVAFLFAGTLVSCEQELEDVTPPSVAAFSTPTVTSSYYIRNEANSQFKIPIGITTVSDRDRTVELSITSSTGAVNGTHFTAPTTITIPAGAALDSLTIKGNFAAYNGGRVDTVNIKITGGDVSPNAYNTSYTLVMRQYCDVDLDAFLGSFLNTRDAPGGGPYATQIKDYTVTGPSSAKVTISNLGEAWIADPSVVFPDITFDIDFSNPASFSAKIPTQQVEATDFFGYGPANIIDAGGGTFSSCANTITLKWRIRVSAGNFEIVTTTLTR